MHLDLTLKSLEKTPILPLSYQYELGCWIFRVLEKGNRNLAHFLHDGGYEHHQHRRFKFYTFSHLRVPRRDIQADRLVIKCPEIYFTISCLVEEAAQRLVLGLLRNTEPFEIGDRISRGRFLVQNVNIRLDPINSETVHLRTTSPLLVGRPKIKPNGKLSEDFLAPGDSDYIRYFTQNLLTKYDTAYREGLVGEADLSSPIDFKLISERPAKKGIRIRAFTPAETKNIGYLFDFQLSAPRELIRLGMLAGFGEENSMGFGAVEKVTSQSTRHSS